MNLSNGKSFLRSWKVRVSAIAAFAVALGAFASLFQWQKTASAQETQNTDNARQIETDRKLASKIRTLTDRSAEGLKVRKTANGEEIDLGGRFQNVMLAQITDGEPAAACITSLGEANAFFGKNLETGEVLPESLRMERKKTAAAHGMSVEEYSFYSKLIENAANSSVAANIQIVNADSPGEGFFDPTPATPEGGNVGTTRGEQRLLLFNEAARIWGQFLDSTVTINVESKFDPLTPCTTSGGVLGGASTITVNRDFNNAVAPGTWHHAALANKRAGTDLNTMGNDIRATFNTDVDNGCLGAGSRFYYGFDNSTPPARINLLVVLLHEIGHGLGFSQFANGQTGALFNGFPDVYNRNLFDRTTGKYWNQMTNAERAASALNSGNVLWDGGSVKVASGFLTQGREASTGRVQMYTPSSFEPGSSISHWSTAASPNLLMEPFISVGLPLTLDLTRQQLRDVGWYRDSDANGTPDTITLTAPTARGLAIGSSVTVTWTTAGGFNRNVSIDLSLDGGSTYPTVLANDIPNTGSFTFTVPNAPTNSARLRVREVNFADPAGVSFAPFAINATGAPARTAYDFDGDGRSDVSVFREGATANWFVSRSQAGFLGASFGTTGDIIAPADFDGDGRTDISVFRPGATANWYRLNSSNNTFTGVEFGTSGDKPVPGDYDGDGRADISVFRAGNFFRLNSSNGAFAAVAFGTAGDIPLVANFDGDGRTDIAVFRPGATANFFSLSSANGNQFVSVPFGTTGDVPAIGDFDGDGRDDVSVYRPGAQSNFFRINSGNGAFVGFAFGTTGDVPVIGDYDGDGRADVSVFRAGNWFLQQSTQGFTGIAFGASTDKPIPAAYIQ
jgi:hypothetical protein